MVRRSQDLERHVDDESPEDHAAEAAGAAEDHDRVDRDQQGRVEVAREHRGLERGEERAGQPRDARAEGERVELEPVDRHPHHLGGQRVLAQRVPRPPGARPVDEVDGGEADQEEDQGDPVVALERLELLPEDVERVEVRDPVRAVRDVVAAGETEDRDPVPVVRHRHEELAEEERHDREVVADETARRQRDEQAEQNRRSGRDDQDQRRRPVLVELARGQHRVDVGAEAEEGDVAEVEQPGCADDDVEPQREEHVDQRVEADPDDVAVVRQEREQRRHGSERGIERGVRELARGVHGSGRSHRGSRSRRLSCEATHSSAPIFGWVGGGVSGASGDIRPSGSLRGRECRWGGGS